MSAKPKRIARPGISPQTGDMEPDIIRGAMNNDLDEVQAALDRNPRDINKQHDFFGYTALHIAAGQGNISMVEFLIQQPVLKFLKDRWGRDPLDIAMAYGHLEIKKRLTRFRVNQLKLSGSWEGIRQPRI